MTLTCICQNCKQANFILEVQKYEKPYSAIIECNLCGVESAFKIYYPNDGSNTKPTILRSVRLKEDEFMCSECFGVYPKGRTDQEALEVAQIQSNDPDLTIEQTEIVCQDCFNKVIIPTLN